MEVGTDYKFRDDLFNPKEDGSTVPIELMVDPFAGVVYRYTTVGFKVGEDDVPRLRYDYEIIKTNDLSMVTLRKNEKFNTMLGLILNAMLLDLGDASEVEAGANNSKEPDTEGRLHEKSSSVSEG
jgi:hypothetical protein